MESIMRSLKKKKKHTHAAKSCSARKEKSIHRVTAGVRPRREPHTRVTTFWNVVDGAVYHGLNTVGLLQDYIYIIKQPGLGRRRQRRYVVG